MMMIVNYILIKLVYIKKNKILKLSTVYKLKFL